MNSLFAANFLLEVRVGSNGTDSFFSPSEYVHGSWEPSPSLMSEQNLTTDLEHKDGMKLSINRYYIRLTSESLQVTSLCQTNIIPSILES